MTAIDKKSRSTHSDSTTIVNILDNFMVEQTDKTLLSITGPDAKTFLNGQISANLATLPNDQHTWAVYCNRQGKMLAELLVIPYQDGYLLQVDHSLANLVQQTLQQYAVFSKISINQALSFHSLAIHASELSKLDLSWFANLTQEPGHIAKINDIIWLRPFHHAPNYLLALTKRTESLTELKQSLAKHCKQVPTHWWQAVHIQQGLANLTQATSGLYNPFELHFDQHHAIAFDKGCYLGQEIISRIHFQGKVKTHCYRVQITADKPVKLVIGQQLFDSSQRITSTIINTATIQEQPWLQASLITSKLTLDQLNTCYTTNNTPLLVKAH